jgi:hypothetical protein
MRCGLPVLVALALAAPATAQTVTVDEGTFRVLVGGREVGMETFSIRQNGAGADAVVIAQGRVALPEAAEVVANVQFGGTVLRPVAYDVELRGSDARRIRAAIAGSRASARTVSSGGETMKEYLVSDGAVLLDEGVAHHYYFLARRAAGGATRVPVIIPRENRQVQATVSAAGEESVAIGGGSARGRKLTVTLTGGDTRSVWVDAEGRVLKVEVPAKGYVAIRTALP